MIEEDPKYDATTAALIAAASATDTSAVDTTATAECDLPAKKLSNSQRRSKRSGKRHLKTSPTQQETNDNQKVSTN